MAKLHSLKITLVAALLSLGFVANAAAHSPSGRRRTGTIEDVDLSTKHLTFRADRDEEAQTFVWNKRTRFVRGISFVEASTLRNGARVDATVHAPFFGERFVSRVILLKPTPPARPRK